MPPTLIPTAPRNGDSNRPKERLTLEQAAERVRTEDDGKAARGHQRGCGVLVIESNPDQQWRVSRMLTLEGHRVVGTSSGDGALALLEQWPVDLVLVSERLQGVGMDGIEVAQIISERSPETPVVLMVEDEAHPAAALVGAVACLVKPFRLEALRELLRSLDLGPGLTPAPAE